RARPDINVVAEHRRRYLFNVAQFRDYAVTDAAVVPELRVAADNEIPEVINDEVATERRFARELDAGDDLNELVRHFVNHRWPHAVTPAAEATYDHRPEALGSPIAVVGAKIIADVLEHGGLNVSLLRQIRS